MRRLSGFTLIELMITLTILGIVAAYAVPSFNQFIEGNRNRNAGYELFRSLNYARSIAVSRQKTITLCASDDGENCNNGSDWTDGGIIFEDSDRDGDRASDEVLLQLVEVAPRGSEIKLYAGGSIDYLRYKPDGRLAASGNFKFCPRDNEAGRGWIIVFFHSGRPYFGRNSSGIAIDGSGNRLACPLS